MDDGYRVQVDEGRHEVCGRPSGLTDELERSTACSHCAQGLVTLTISMPGTLLHTCSGSERVKEVSDEGYFHGAPMTTNRTVGLNTVYQGLDIAHDASVTNPLQMGLKQLGVNPHKRV